MYSMYTYMKICIRLNISFPASNISHIIVLLFWRNEVGNSTGTEFEGFRRSMDYLESKNLSVATLITDRHSKIAKHMREKYPNITHYTLTFGT